MHRASYNLLVQRLVCVSVGACVSLFDKHVMVFAHLHIAVSFHTFRFAFL